MIEVAPAQEADITRVVQVLRQCAQHLESQGVDQWDDVYPSLETIANDVRNGSTYIATNASACVGTVTMDDIQYSEYQQIRWMTDGVPVLAVHQLAVLPEWQGRAIGRKLMGFVEQFATAHGQGVIRLEAYSRNPTSMQFYERQRYIRVGEVCFPKRKVPFVCYEKPLNAFQIMPVTIEDLPGVRELFREYEKSLPFDLSFQHFQRETDTLPGRYAPPSGRMLLARGAGQAVGCVALRQIGEKLCEMKRLYVQPAFQGRGIGRALAQAIIEEARRIGYKRMRLDTAVEPARRLYGSLGFVEIPPYEEVPLEGVTFMELIL